MRMLLSLLLIGFCLSGCGEWRPYRLHNPATGQTAACHTSWGLMLAAHGTPVAAEDVRNLHDCIAECEAHGYVLNDPDGVPPEPAPPHTPRRQGWAQCEAVSRFIDPPRT